MPDKPRTFRRKGPSRPAQRQGGSAGLRDTSARYQRLRERLMTAEPLCRYHKAQGQIVAATILDHIIALALGGTNDPDNLAPACLDCNTDKARAEQAYLRKGYDVRFVASDPELGRWLRLSQVVHPEGQ